MKNSFITLFLLAFYLIPCGAQPTEKPSQPTKPHIIAGTGVGLRFFSPVLKVSSFIVERPIGQYQHIGIQFAKIFENSNETYFYGSQLLNDGFEVGMYGKFFFHGRFTGRKTGFYLGADFRLGRRKYGFAQYNPTFPTAPDFQIQKYDTTTILFLWGMQWRFGKYVVFELSAPFGYESVRYASHQDPYSGYGFFSEKSPVLSPTLMIGIAL